MKFADKTKLRMLLLKFESERHCLLKNTIEPILEGKNVNQISKIKIFEFECNNSKF